MAKKPKVETRRGVSPVGMASFPTLFTPKKIRENDPKEEPKFRLTHVYKPAKFDATNKELFNQMVSYVNEVAEAEILDSFEDFEAEGVEYTAAEMVAAFHTSLDEHKATPLKAHFAAFKELKWWDKKDQMVRSCRSPFLLGKNDEYVDDDAVFVRISSKADRPPEVVDQSREPLEEKDVYGGALVRCSYTTYPYNNMGNRGVTIYMGNVQKVGAGQRIGGGPSAKDEFDDVETEDVAF